MAKKCSVSQLLTTLVRNLGPKFKNQVRMFCEEDASDCNGVLEISKAYWSSEELTFWCFCHQLISLDC